MEQVMQIGLCIMGFIGFAIGFFTIGLVFCNSEHFSGTGKPDDTGPE